MKKFLETDKIKEEKIKDLQVLNNQLTINSTSIDRGKNKIHTSHDFSSSKKKIKG
jgi:hypothetical protein